eukprot:jgi/Galph1/547/GphlegSOOS_G5169.1
MVAKRKPRYKGPGSVLAENPVAHRNYEVLEKLHCGLQLTGTETKSAREGKVNLKEGYARVQKGELWLLNVQISPHGTSRMLYNHEPKRPRKLLARYSEIIKLKQRQQEKRQTLIPLKMYVNERNFIKVEIATAIGKKTYDKKKALKEKEQEREVKRIIKQRMYEE